MNLLAKLRATRCHRLVFQYLTQADTKPWQPGPYAGVELKILHKNEATGGLVVLRAVSRDHRDAESASGLSLREAAAVGRRRSPGEALTRRPARAAYDVAADGDGPPTRPTCMYR